MIEYDDPYLEDLYLTLYEDLLEGIEICFNWKNPFLEGIIDMNKQGPYLQKESDYEGKVYHPERDESFHITIKIEHSEGLVFPSLSFPKFSKPFQEYYSEHLNILKSRITYEISNATRKKDLYEEYLNQYTKKVSAKKTRKLFEILHITGKQKPKFDFLVDTAISQNLLDWLEATHWSKFESKWGLIDSRFLIPGKEKEAEKFFKSRFSNENKNGLLLKSEDVEKAISFIIYHPNRSIPFVAKIHPLQGTWATARPFVEFYYKYLVGKGITALDVAKVIHECFEIKSGTPNTLATNFRRIYDPNHTN